MIGYTYASYNIKPTVSNPWMWGGKNWLVRILPSEPFTSSETMVLGEVKKKDKKKDKKKERNKRQYYAVRPFSLILNEHVFLQEQRPNHKVYVCFHATTLSVHDWTSIPCFGWHTSLLLNFFSEKLATFKLLSCKCWHQLNPPSDPGRHWLTFCEPTHPPSL